MSKSPGRLSNSMMALLLRSPLHGVLSNNFMLITVTGRRSGRPITTPVNYVRDGVDLLIVSWRDRVWWKNLRGGAPVTVRLQGNTHKGVGCAIEEQSSVAEHLATIMRQMPAYQKSWAITLAPDGQPLDREAFAKLVQSKIIVRISELKQVSL